MAVVRKKKRGLGLFGRQGANGDVMLIDSYHVGSIRSERPVLVTADAAVAGDIFAPNVTIAGLVYGFVIAQELLIESGGQVWGDVYCQLMEIDGHGLVNGWMSTIDEDVFDALMNNDTNLHDFQHERYSVKPDVLPAQLQAAVQESLSSFPPDRVNILRQLQQQAALALIARNELERSFDDRLEELTGRVQDEANRLREEVGRLEGERNELRNRVAELNDQTEDKDQQLSDRESALVAARRDLERQIDKTENLQTDFDIQKQKIVQLEAQIDQLEREAQETVLKRDEDAKRMRNLEAASQSSLERANELEEGLIRWQELAEATESKANELQSELNTLRLQIDEGSKTIEKAHRKADHYEMETIGLQDQVRDLERKLDMASSANEENRQLTSQVSSLEAELNKLREQLETAEATEIQLQEIKARAAELEGQLERKNHDLKVTKQAMVESTSALTEVKRSKEQLEQELLTAREQAAALEIAKSQIEQLQTDLTEANQQVNQLQGDLRDLERQSQRQLNHLQPQMEQLETENRELREKLSWAQSNLHTNEEKLGHARKRVRANEQQMTQLQAELAEQRRLVEEAKNRPDPVVVARLETQIATLQADQEQQQSKIGELEKLAKMGQQQVADFEREIEIYEQNISAQGRQLAELQAVLVEKDIYLQKVVDGAKKQAADLQHVKKMASKHIKKLEGKLSAKTKQLNDLAAVIERRQKKNGA